MIKILFFIETLTGGGAEKVLRDLVNHMDQTRFDITVQTAFPCDASKYLVAGIRYKSMYSSASKANRLRYRAEAESGLAYRLHIRDDYDIECAYLEMGSTKVMAASTNKKAKKLAWVHCDLMKEISNPSSYVEKTEPWYEKFDRVVCVSQTAKESFDKLFQNCFHSEVVYNVVDDTTIRSKAQLPLPAGTAKRRLTVLSVGRLTAQKNFMRLLMAHKRVLDTGLEHDLWILGEGSERSALEQFIKENYLQNSVSMPGFAENPYPCMREADLLACSSNSEGFSTFLTEGVVLGKPIVTTNVSGVRELLGDSEFGLVTESEDEAFCRGYEQMLRDPALRDSYSDRVSMRSSDFSAQALTDRTEQFFTQLLED